MTPFELGDKAKSGGNCKGKAVLVLPRPAIPTTPLARPSNRISLAAQENRKSNTVTVLLPGLKPFVGWTENNILGEFSAGGNFSEGVVRCGTACVVVASWPWR